MSITKVPDEELLIFDHEIAAPVEQVFGAFLNPNLLHRWYGPTGWRTRAEDIVLEPYVGGMQRLSMINELDASVSCVLQSRFLAIDPLKELEYAEQLPDHLGNPGGVGVFQPVLLFSPAGGAEAGFPFPSPSAHPLPVRAERPRFFCIRRQNS